MRIHDVAANSEGPWDVPVDLDETAPPAFPISAMAHIPWLHAWIGALAEAYQTPIDLPAVLTLGAVAGAMQKRVLVAPRCGWREPINLYAVVAMPPGSNKSQVHREVLDPIVQWESDRNAASAQQRAQMEISANMLQMRIEKLKKRAASEGAGPERRYAMGQEIYGLQQELAALPPREPLQLLFDDTTAEALERAMSTCAQAIVASAEGKLFDNMAGAYSRMPNLNIYLKAHAGDPVAVNRIGRERVLINDPRLTLLMTVQPQVIQGLNTRREFDGRGLLARMLYSLPQTNIGRRKEDPQPVSDDVRFEYHAAMHYLLEYGNPADRVAGEGHSPETAIRNSELGPDGPALITFDDGADRLFREMRQEIESRLAPDSNDLNGMGGWANKLAGLVARLAAVLHCAKVVRQPWAVPVSDQTMQSAIAISRYAIEHARIAFAVMGADPDTDDARYLRQVLHRFALEKKSGAVARRQVWQSAKRRLQTSAVFDRALQVLEKHGYVRTHSTQPGGAGRPAQTLLLNPRWTGLPSTPAKMRAMDEEENAPTGDIA
jgi:hypothetical protein